MGKIEGDVSFTLSIFFTEDKSTGWETSHPPLYVFLLNIKLEGKL